MVNDDEPRLETEMAVGVAKQDDNDYIAQKHTQTLP